MARVVGKSAGFAVAVGWLASGCSVGAQTPVHVSASPWDLPPGNQTAPTPMPVPTELPAAAQGPYPVDYVTDGDTLTILQDGTRTKIRVVGIDTPETKDPRKAVQCFGREASDRAKAMLEGNQVYLEFDPTTSRYDKYGRELANVWIRDKGSFGLLMISQGFAHEYTYDFPYEYQAEHKAAQQYAHGHNLGLWSPTTCAGDTTKSAR